MSWVLKGLFTLLFLFSFQSFALNTKVSMFKPEQQVKSISEFQKGIQKDFQKARRSIMAVEEPQAFTGLVENKEDFSSRNTELVLNLL